MEQIEVVRYIVDYGVLGLLGILSIISIALGIERAVFYRRISLGAYSHPKELELALTQRLSPIATIGSSAPYIGLLGTVLSIMLTFYAIGEHGGDIDAGIIMKDLALALKATAAGLLVAIPATAIYNALLTGVERSIASWEIMQDKRDDTNETFEI